MRCIISRLRKMSHSEDTTKLLEIERKRVREAFHERYVRYNEAIKAPGANMAALNAEAERELRFIISVPSVLDCPSEWPERAILVCISMTGFLYRLLESPVPSSDWTEITKSVIEVGNHARVSVSKFEENEIIRFMNARWLEMNQCVQALTVALP